MRLIEQDAVEGLANNSASPFAKPNHYNCMAIMFNTVVNFVEVQLPDTLFIFRTLRHLASDCTKLR